MQTHTLIIASGFIAGVPYRNPDLTVVENGHGLDLKPEPKNPYDPDAIKIYHQLSGQHLGYVPREQTVAVHRAQRAGFTPTAQVTCYQPGVKWKELGFGVFVEAQLPS